MPQRLRLWIAGLQAVQAWRNRELLKKGKRLAAKTQMQRKDDRKIHVVFLETRRAFWLNHASIYSAMKGASTFDVHVIAVPKRTPGGDFDWDEYRHLIAFFDQEGIPCHHAYDFETRTWINPLRFVLPNVVFPSQPYDYQVNYMYGSSYWKHFCDVCFVDYGVNVAAFPFSAPESFFGNCRFLFAQSEMDWTILAKLVPEHAGKLVVTGHPVLDAYLHPLQSAKRLSFKSPKSMRRIIWAPHFTVSSGKTGHHFSNFFEYYELFIQLAQKYPELEIIMRPHPALFNFMVNCGLKTNQEALEYRSRFEELTNCRIYDDADYIALFRQSDALVLDSISFIGAYAPTGKPVCFLESPQRERLSPVGERLLHAYYAAWNQTEVQDFIEKIVLDGKDPRKQERQEVVRKVLYMPPEGAGERIAKEIKVHLSKRNQLSDG